MIIDAYITARSVDFVNITIITDSDSLLIITDNKQIIKIKNPNISFRSQFFYQYKWKSSQSSSAINLNIIQNNDSTQINTSLLSPPEGKKITRFGILADVHINSSNENYLPQSSKRLYTQANYLCKKYIKRLEELNADFIIFPGDVMDSGSLNYLKTAKNILSQSKIPCYPIIGNHEEYGEVTRYDFYKAFSLPQEGYYSFTKKNVHFIMLDTPDQSALNKNTKQFQWLKQELQKYGNSHNVLLFSHFSLILHPCVQGLKNDGLQQMHQYQEVLNLLKQYPGVKVFFAGHKNNPSRIIKDGINHILCPQLIQAPCGFYMVDVYEKGLLCSFYEIDEKHFVQVSRNAYGNDWRQRCGTEESRNFVLRW